MFFLSPFARFRFYAGRAAWLLVCMLPGFALAQEDLYVYVTNLFSNDVSVYSTNADGTLSAVATFGGVGTGPAGVTIRGDQAFMYVVGTNNDSLHVVDTRTNTVVQSITTGLNDPRDPAISPDGKRLYVPNNGGNLNNVAVFTIDTLSGQLTADGTITVGHDPRSVVFTPNGTRAYVVNQDSTGGGSGSVSVIDVATSAVTATVATGGQLFDSAVSPDGSRVYVSNVNNLGQIFAIDTATNTVVATIAATNNPRGVAVNGDGTKLYVNQLGIHSVSVVDVASETIVANTGAGQAPNDFTLSPTGEFAYVASQNDDSVVNFSVAAGTGLLTANGSVAAGDNPLNIIICRRGNALLTTGNTFVAHTGAALGCTGSNAEFTGGTLLVNGAAQTFVTPITVGAAGGTIDTNGNDASVSGVISGNGALTKSGAGTLTLAGANSHTGAMTISSGTLQVTGSLAAGSTITVAAGATLGGTGTINGNVILEIGANLSPGLTITGSLINRAGPPPTVITSVRRNVTLHGRIDITANGTIDSGYLQGTITSQGLITGTIRLGPNTSLSGGTLSGNISGTETSPARIEAEILPGTLLEHVLILSGSRVDSGVRVGRNVIFESGVSIPAGLDLTQSLELVTWHAWSPYRVPLLDVALDHPAGGMSTTGTILDDLELLDEMQSADATLSQNATGELLMRFGDRRSVLLPVNVRLRDDEEPGLHVNEDGSVLFVTSWYTVRALQAPAEIGMFTDALFASDLAIDYRDQIGATLIVRSLNFSIADYYAARPDLYVVPTAGDSTGLQSFARPGMPGHAGLAWVFEDEASGSLFRQELLPMPVDWPQLQARLGMLTGVSSVTIATDGVITVRQGEQLVRVKADYRVTKGRDSGLPLAVQVIGDSNSDGLFDYRVVYANGDSQVFYRLPLQ